MKRGRTLLALLTAVCLLAVNVFSAILPSYARLSGGDMWRGRVSDGGADTYTGRGGEDALLLLQGGQCVLLGAVDGGIDIPLDMPAGGTTVVEVSHEDWVTAQLSGNLLTILSPLERETVVETGDGSAEGETPPAEGETTPDEGETPPDEGETPPDEGEIPPDEGETPPDEGETPPDEGETTPGEGETPPDEGETTPGEGETPPDEGETTPDEGETPPDEGETPSDEGETPPGEGETPPDEGETTPSEGETPPDEGETPPDEGEPPPSEGETPPDEGETPPDEGETPPSEGETPPDEGETPPDEGGTSPDGGETPPDEGGTTPDEGETTPSEGETPPDEGGTPPDEGGTTPDESEPGGDESGENEPGGNETGEETGPDEPVETIVEYRPDPVQVTVTWTGESGESRSAVFLLSGPQSCEEAGTVLLDDELSCYAADIPVVLQTVGPTECVLPLSGGSFPGWTRYTVNGERCLLYTPDVLRLPPDAVVTLDLSLTGLADTVTIAGHELSFHETCQVDVGWDPIVMGDSALLIPTFYLWGSVEPMVSFERLERLTGGGYAWVADDSIHCTGDAGTIIMTPNGTPPGTYRVHIYWIDPTGVELFSLAFPFCVFYESGLGTAEAVSYQIVPLA